jgi:hypothetical protein
MQGDREPRLRNRYQDQTMCGAEDENRIADARELREAAFQA